MVVPDRLMMSQRILLLPARATLIGKTEIPTAITQRKPNLFNFDRSMLNLLFVFIGKIPRSETARTGIRSPNRAGKSTSQWENEGHNQADDGKERVALSFRC
jgi:hypothetical protein